jgi:hypothetical protein
LGQEDIYDGEPWHVSVEPAGTITPVAQTELVPITPKPAWDGLPIYDILTERLSRLERVLVAHGFGDPVPRIQFHLGILRRLRQRPGVDNDETLWSLVEATELADMYCSLPVMSAKTLREKFGAILEGPFNPQEETAASNLARNTAFELHLAGWLSHKGIPTRICHNPDVLCEMADRRLFIQCKRPFSRRKIEDNIKRACKQLSIDLNSAGDTRNRGVVAISMTKAINPGTMFLQVRTEANLTPALSSQMRALATYYVSRFIKGRRIIGIVFHVITAALVEDISEYRTAQLLALCPSAEASEADRVLLRHVFLRRR